MAGNNSTLARLGVVQLGLQSTDIFVLPVQRLDKLSELGFEFAQRQFAPRLGVQRAPRQVIASLRDGEFRFAVPFLDFST